MAAPRVASPHSRDTARPASLNSLHFLGLWMEGLQKHFPASCVLQAGGAGYGAAGSGLLTLPTPNPRCSQSETQLTPAQAKGLGCGLSLPVVCPWLWFVPGCCLSLAAPANADRALLLSRGDL